MDGRAWWALVYAIAESNTTKQLTHTCMCISAQFLREWQVCVPWNTHFMTALLEQLAYCQ